MSQENNTQEINFSEEKTTSSENLQEQQVSVPQTASNNKILIIVIMLLLAIVLGILGAYLFFDVLGKEDSSDNEEDTLQEEVEEEITPTEVKPSPTQVYRNVQPTEELYSSCIASDFDGEEYAHGEKYTTLDGCQTCGCFDGEWICEVEDRCIVLDSDCIYDGVVYHTGDSFPATDGCNTCTCNDGNVSCTLMLCL